MKQTDENKKIAQKARAAILIGATAEKLATAIRDAGKSTVKIEMAESLAQAVETAKSLAVADDVVVLSPACASYDMFENFAQRGKMFCQLVLGRKK